MSTSGRFRTYVLIPLAFSLSVGFGVGVGFVSGVLASLVTIAGTM